MKSICSALCRSIVRKKLYPRKVERQCRDLKGRDLTFGSSCSQLLLCTVRGAKFYRTLVYRYSAGPSGFTDQLDFRTRVWLYHFLYSWRICSESQPRLPAMGVHTGLVGSDASEERSSFTAVNLAFEMEQGVRCDNKVKDGLMKDHFPEILLHSSLPSQQEESKFSSTPPTTPSTSDYAHSTSSRSYSPDNSEPALTGDKSQSIDSLDSSSGVATSKTKSNPESIEDAHSSRSSTTDAEVFPSGSDKRYSLSSEAEVDSTAVASSPKTSVASADRSAILSMFSLSNNKGPRKKGIRQALATGWSNMKRIQTGPRDLRGLSRYVRLLLRMRKAKNQNLNVPTVFDRTCAKHPHKIAFYFEDEEWDFARVQEYSLRVAQVFRGKVVKGDAVALLMENRVQYIAIWLGLARLGAVPALLNSNLRLKSLSHCINTADCKLIISSLELQHAIEEIRSEVSTLPLYLFGASLDSTKTPLEGSQDLDALLKEAPAEVPPEQASVNFTDKVVYIYTSGTTGLPKAAVITHSRALLIGEGTFIVMDFKISDVVYTPLPLFHMSGGIMTVGLTLFCGSATAIRSKFSASHFWTDCIKYNATVRASRSTSFCLRMFRYLFAAVGMLCMVDINSKDVVYDPLPLYHTAGGNIGVGMTFTDGVTVAIKKKFSVRSYFPDCQRYGCTVAQYIGEICRYLLNSPPSPADTQHKLRVVFGNGLRPQIWQQFQDRFAIPRVSEFYGATEGNANIVNIDGRVGAVGFLSVLIPSVYPCALIKVHPETGVPERDDDGVCIRCKPGKGTVM
ncbi:AMP-dependent synthetase/ligase, partial [Trinorchestia longiramus]